MTVWEIVVFSLFFISALITRRAQSVILFSFFLCYFSFTYVFTFTYPLISAAFWLPLIATTIGHWIIYLRFIGWKESHHKATIFVFAFMNMYLFGCLSEWHYLTYVFFDTFYSPIFDTLYLVLVMLSGMDILKSDILVKSCANHRKDSTNVQKRGVFIL